MKYLTLEEWKNKGKELFGEDVTKWKFRCPNCNGIQTLQDFIDNDVKIPEPDNVFYYSCIGRWVKGRGCDWTLGGLLQIHKTEVITDEGKKIPVFEFAQ